MKNILWLHSTSCGGDTISLLNAEEPDFMTAIKTIELNFAWHPTLFLKKDIDAKQICTDFINGKNKLDFFIIEGAIQLGPDGTGSICKFFDEPFLDWAKKLSDVAEYTFAIGSCATTGGVLSLGDDYVDATGLQWHRDKIGGALGKDYRSKSGFPVINIPGCPAHPDWILETLYMVANGKLKLEDLDYANRPYYFYSSLAHHACPRNEFYEFKSSAEELGQKGCLFEFLGCRGTLCESDCNLRLWMGRTGSCPRGGFPCIACTSQTFPNPNCDYFKTEKIGNIPVTLPSDVSKAWYIGISGLSKLATPERLKVNATSSYVKFKLKKGNIGNKNEKDT